MTSLLRPRLLRATAAFALGLALAAPARADVTADQVWEYLRLATSVQGITLSANHSRRGDQLLLTRVRLDLPDGSAVILPDIALHETPDHSVTVELPKRFPLTLDLPPKPGDPDMLSLTVASPDLAITIRSLDAQVDYALSASSISASLDKFDLAPGGTSGPIDVFFALAAADLALDWKSATTSRERSGDSQLSVGTIHAEFRIDAPDEPLKAAAALDISALSAKLKGFAPADTWYVLDEIDRTGRPSFPELMDLTDRGLMLDASVTYGPIAVTMDAPVSPDGPTAAEFSASKGGISLGFDRKGFAYDESWGPSRVYVRTNDPTSPVATIEAMLEEYRTTWRLGFPDSATPDNAPEWGILFRLKGFGLSDQLWSLADPQKLLPHDPMSLVIDLSGTYTLDPKVMAPDWAPKPDDPPPVTAASLNLTDFLVSGLGLSSTGSGGFGFDFTDMTTFDGAPLPSGKMSFVTIGANGLIDRLDRMGVLPEEDRTAARFGLLFLGRIEGGEDRLVTGIEFRDRGFYLNGQKIR